MWFAWYMACLYPFLSIIFLVMIVKIFGFTKKMFFILLGLIFLTYLISVVYIFFRLSIVVSNPNFFSW
jgi:hypothetical protein